MILKKETEPLQIEYLDYLTVIVDPIWTVQRKALKYKESEIDYFQLLSLEKEPDKVEYIDEIFIEGFDKPENEIQYVERMEIKNKNQKFTQRTFFRKK